MDKGKFSQPRPYRDEERQIEEAFRQITGKNASPKKPKQTLREAASGAFPKPTEETLHIPAQVLFQDAGTVIPVEPQPLPVQEPPIEEMISREIMGAYEDILPEEPEQEDAYEPEESPGFWDKLMDFCINNRKGVLIGLCSAAILLLAAVIVTLTVVISGNTSDDRILNNVMIAGVNVGGMTKNQAISAVKQATSHTYSVEDMVVEIAGTQLRLSPKKTGASLDVKAAVNAAFEYGRTGTQAERDKAYSNSLTGNHTIGLLPYLRLDTGYIRQELEKHSGSNGSTLTQATYGLEGSYPSLRADDFDPSAAQTLVLTMGTPGVSFDVDKVYDQILDAYSLHIFHVAADGVRPTEEPDPVDLQVIYDEFYVAPKDSTLDRNTFEVIPGSYGYEFDLEQAQRMVDSAQYGEVLRIPMVFIEPELMDDTFLFRDVLGESVTPVTGTKNRITNIRLACEAMDGTILQPGETFSYNNCLGERTEERGYKSAPAYSGNALTDSIGGGICQGSTTLYHCALLADMEIVSRINHGFPVSYIDYGMDATVSWGGPDFQFRNSTAYPIQIRASLSGSYLSVQILGTEERDYFVKMDYTVTNVFEPDTEYVDYPHDNPEGYRDGDVIQEGVTGYAVKTYKLKYSRSTGKLISKDFETTSRYTTLNELIARVAPPETTVPETTVPETTVPESTVPETTVPEVTVPEPTVPQVTVPQPTEPVLIIPQAPVVDTPDAA